jgi:hypothetical protein
VTVGGSSDASASSRSATANRSTGPGFPPRSVSLKSTSGSGSFQRVRSGMPVEATSYWRGSPSTRRSTPASCSTDPTWCRTRAGSQAMMDCPGRRAGISLASELTLAKPRPLSGTAVRKRERPAVASLPVGTRWRVRDRLDQTLGVTQGRAMLPAAGRMPRFALGAARQRCWRDAQTPALDPVRLPPRA